jgi:hypothetical protein
MIKVVLTVSTLAVFSVYLLLLRESSSLEETYLGQCSHKDLPFRHYQVNHSKIEMEDDVLMVMPLDLACKPDSFGYSQDEAERLFPDKSFPRCEDLVASKGYLDYNSTDHSFSLSCPSKYKGKYLLGVPYDQEEFGYFEFTQTPQDYQASVSLNTEYFFASCDPTTANFEYVEYHNRLNASALARAQATLTTRPQHILMVVLDSVSRRSFFRKLPRTSALLNSLTEHEVFDFKVHNVAGEYSADSFMPTFIGDRAFSRFKERVEGDPLYETAVWRHMHLNVSSPLGFRYLHGDRRLRQRLGSVHWPQPWH